MYQELIDALMQASNVARDEAQRLRDLRMKALVENRDQEAQMHDEDRTEWVEHRKNFERALTSALALLRRNTVISE